MGCVSVMCGMCECVSVWVCGYVCGCVGVCVRVCVCVCVCGVCGLCRCVGVWVFSHLILHVCSCSDGRYLHKLATG